MLTRDLLWRLASGSSLDGIFSESMSSAFPTGASAAVTVDAESAETFAYDNRTPRPASTLAGFGRSDTLLFTNKLFDSNNDGIITFGRDGKLNLTGNKGSDTLTIAGISSNLGLRFLGERSGGYLYADGSVRPIGAIESRLGNDALVGDRASTRQDVFFFDTALKHNLGDDTIGRFGLNDLLVVTDALDSAAVGETVALDAAGRIGLPSGGSVRIADETGAVLPALVFAGVVTHRGVNYHIYTRVSSTAGVDDLRLHGYTGGGAGSAPTVAGPLTVGATEDGAPVLLDLLTGATGASALSVTGLPTLAAGLSVAGATLTIDPTNPAFDSLAEGANRVLTIAYRVRDAAGRTVNQTATVTVTGVNDGPAVVAPLVAGATEGDTSFTLDLLAGASDVDTGDALAIANVGGLVDGLSLSGATLLVDPSDAAFAGLAQGEVREIILTFDVIDGKGGSVAQSVTLTVTGTGTTPPTVTGPLTAGVTEDTGEQRVDLLAGAIGSTAGDTLSVTDLTALPTGVTVDGADLVIDTNASVFQSLGAGDTREIALDYRVSDQDGETVAQRVMVAVTGVNDAPVVAATLARGVTEGSAPVLVDLLAGANDVDVGDVLAVTNVTGLVAGVTLSGSSLTVDPASAAFAGLAAGETREIVIAYDVVDNAGGSVAQSFTLTVTGIDQGAAQPPATPVITGFSDDTGTLGDRITNDAMLTLSGTGEAGATVALYRDGTLVGNATVGSTGVWSADVTGTTADGAHDFTATATARGLTSSASTKFAVTVDTDGPDAPSFDLAATDAVGDPANHQTEAARVTLVGTAEAGTTLTLAGTGQTTIASNAGTFRFVDIALAEGVNSVEIIASDVAGNTASTTVDVTRLQPDNDGNMVLDWIGNALEAIRMDASAPNVASRSLAMESLAVFDALNAVNGAPGYAITFTAAAGSSAEAAVAAAAHTILTYLYPTQKAALDAKYVASLAEITDGAAEDNGVAAGMEVAERLIAQRQSDGWQDLVTEVGGEAVGQWRPTGPMYSIAESPQWATLDTFSLISPDQFRADPVPSLTSAEYAAALNEVKSLGAGNSTTRTAEQTQIARFWADGLGTFTPPGHWNAIAADAAKAAGGSLSADARLFAQLNVAAADAAIAGWDTKYTFVTWRPETAIQEGNSIGNAGITGDESWTPLLITPNHPEYVSGHSTFSAAAAEILKATFGADYAFSTTSQSLPGVVRSFTSFDQAVDEAGRSRIYGGIHFEFSNQAGQELGTQVGQWVLRSFDLKEDVQPPKITFSAPSGIVTNTTFSIAGAATDTLSGIASLTVAIDGAAAVAVTLGSDGAFSLPSGLLTDGSDDGAHSFVFTATDAAGNATTATFAATLDVAAPTLTLGADSVADGGTLASGARLTGIAHPTGSAISALSYSFDGGKAVPVSFNVGTGAFNTILDLSSLASGDHELAVTIRDTAGNTTVQTLDLTLPTLAAFKVNSVTPVNGAADVGVTFRPEVFFSRAVDKATLTANSLFATDASGTKLDATIVASDDGKSASLFFKNAMPGASNVTIHVDGDAVKAAADGLALDADGDGAAGGDLAATFTTVSTTPVQNTTITGKVLDPGGDLKPMTFDDVRAGPDQQLHTADDVYLNPLAGVKVYILGRESEFVLTDSKGNFTLTNVPTGSVKVAVDGRTATNSPSGFFFPEMVMDVTVRAGETNTVMGGMGTQQEQDANAKDPAVYLPRVLSNILQEVSDTEPTTITVVEGAGGALTDVQRQQLKLTIEPGSLVDENGNPLENAQVGISAVPPELVMDMLPPGVLQHTFDITIQTPGAAALTTPATITMPNVFNLKPGEKTFLLSFDHTTGKLVIDGTMTVSADGLTVTTDPGQGVTKPGWHGMTPPGGCGGDGGPPLPPPPPTPNDTSETAAPQTLQLITGDGSAFNFSELKWTAPEKLPETPPYDGDDADCPPPAPDLPDKKQPYLTITIEVDGPLKDYMKKLGNVSLNGESFTLRAGTGVTKTFDFDAKTFEEMFTGGIKGIDKNILFGSKIKITEIEGKTDGSTHTKTSEIYVSRFVDATDDKHTDGQMEFTKVVNDGAAGEVRKAEYEIRAGSTQPEFKVADGTHFFNVAGSEVWFDPTGTGNGDRTDKLEVRWAATGEKAGDINLKGKATDGQYVFVDRASLLATLNAIATGTDPNTDYTQVTAAELRLIDNLAADGVTAAPTERSDMADAIVNKFKAYYAPWAKGVITSKPASGDFITISFSTYQEGGVKAAGLYGTSSPAGGVDNVFSATGIKGLITKQADYNKAEFAFRLDTLINPNYSGTVNVHPDTQLEFWNLAGNGTDFIQMVTETAVHEYGHTLSLAHTYKTFTTGTGSAIKLTAAGNQTDIMMGHAGDQPSSHGGNLSFKDQTSTTMLMSADMSYTIANSLTVAAYYYANIVTEGGFSVPAGVGGVEEPEDPSIDFPGKHIALFDMDTGLNVVDAIDFGAFVADAFSATLATKTFAIVNYGTETVTINAPLLVGAAFTLNGFPAAGLSLAPGMAQEFSVSFNPTTIGAATAAFSISSNAEEPIAPITVEGFGQAAGARASVAVIDNNLGGVTAGANVSMTRSFVVRNDGADPLVISKVVPAAGTTGFAVTGVPADIAANPITLAFGESVTFGLQFTGGELGLARGQIALTTNDPTQSTLLVGATATTETARRTFDWGDDYVAVEVNGEILRTTSDAEGHFQFFMPAEADYKITVFDPESGLVAHGSGRTAISGRGTDITSGLVFRASMENDSDSDGLADDIEFAIGSSTVKQDSNGDGLDDFTALAQGMNPIGNDVPKPGIIASLKLNGQAQAVALAASPSNPGQQLAYLATGSYGLAIVDATDPLAPTALAQIDLPGNAADVAVSAQARRAVIATDAGLQIVDVSNPAAATVAEVIPGSYGQVAVIDSIAYASTGSSLVAVDLVTGEVQQTLSLGSSAITGIAQDGAMLYTIDQNRVLRAIDTGSGAMVQQGSLATSSGGNGGIFVADGIAYVGNDNGFQAGFLTVNVANPAAPVLISGADTTSIAGRAIALNGSGLGLVVGNPGGVFGTNVLDVVNTSDPTDTDALVTRFTLPERPNDVAIGSGIGFVAAGSSGLQVINYRTYDFLGVAPTITNVILPADPDPSTPGRQVEEGKAVAIKATIADDVQVRSIEVLVNGTVSRADVAYPWDLRALMPTIASNGSETVTVQIRATDTGGNVALTDAYVFKLTPDATPPRILSQSIADEALRSQNIRSITVRFNEAIASDTATSANIRVLDAQGNAVATTITLLDDGKTVAVAFNQLAVGEYQFVLDRAAVTDLAGNTVGTGMSVADFTVRAFTIEWKDNASGNWFDPAGWDLNRVPTVTDDVLLDLTTPARVSYSGSTQIDTLTMRGTGILSLNSGTLTVTDKIDVDGKLVLNGATVAGGYILDPNSAMRFNSGTLDGMEYRGTLLVRDENGTYGNLTIRNGITLTGADGTGRGALDLSGQYYTYLDFEGTQRLDNTTVTIGAANYVDYIRVRGIYNAVTNRYEATLRLGADTVIDQSGYTYISNYYGGIGEALVNEGVIQVDAANTYFYINGLQVTNAGDIAVTNGADLYVQNGSFINAAGGTVTVSGAGSTAQLNSSATASFSNFGSIRVADGGRIEFYGTFDQSALGDFENNGGTVALGGVLDNTGKTLALGDDTLLDTLVLVNGGTIKGGIVADPGENLRYNNGVLDGVTFRGPLVVRDENNLYGQLTIRNGITLTGADGTGRGVLDMTGAYYSYADFEGTQRLDSTTLTLGDTNGYYDYVRVRGVYNGTSGRYEATLTLGADTIVDQEGYTYFSNYYGGSAEAVRNEGLIQVDAANLPFYFNGLQVTNAGEIAVTNGADLYIQSGSFTNAAGGTLTVSGAGSTARLNNSAANIFSNLGQIRVEDGGRIDLYGTFDLNGLGDFANDGGSVGLGGVLDNTGKTLSFEEGAILGNLVLVGGGTIKGGIVADPDSELRFSQGVLDGVEYRGTLLVRDEIDNYGQLTLRNGTRVVGVDGTGPGLVDLTGQYSSYLDFEGTQTLASTTVLIGSSSYSDYLRVRGVYNPSSGRYEATLTIAADTVLDQEGYAQLSNYHGGTGEALVNQGLIQVDEANLTFYINGLQVTNEGEIVVTNSADLFLQSGSFTNAATGTVTVSGAGSTARLNSNASNIFSNLGTIRVSDGGRVDVFGTFAIDTLGDFQNDGGFVGIGGVLDNTGKILTLGDGSVLDKAVLVSGGTIKGGTIVDGDGDLSISSGVLDGVAYRGLLEVSDETGFNGQLTIRNGMTLTGTDGTGRGTVDLTNASYSYLYMEGTQTLDHATITIGEMNQYDYLYVRGVYNSSTNRYEAAFTLGADTILDQQGHTYLSNYYGGTGEALLNRGLVKVDTANVTFQINGLQVTNAGEIAVTDGAQLYIQNGSFTNAPDGTVSVSGANSSAEIDNGKAAGELLVSDGARLTLTDFAEEADTGAITVEVGGSLFVTNSTLRTDIVFSGVGASFVTLDATSVVTGPISGWSEGDVVTITDFALESYSFAGSELRMLGSDGSEIVLTIDSDAQPGDFSIVTDGIQNTYVARGAFEVGSVVELDDTYENAGETLTLGFGNPIATMILVNETGAVHGGVIDNPGDSLRFDAGILDDVEVRGPLTVQNRYGGFGSLLVRNGLDLTGADGSGTGVLNFGSGGGQVTFEGFQSFDNATVALGTSDSGGAGYIFVQGNLEDDGAIRGGLTLGANVIVDQEASAYVSGNTGGGAEALVNQGLLQIDASGYGFVINQLEFVNEGNIEISNGAYFQVSDGTFSNQALVNVGANSAAYLANGSSVGSLSIETSAGVTLDNFREDQDTGTIRLGEGGMLTVSGSTLRADIEFVGEGGSAIVIDTATSLLGAIVGWSSGDEVRLEGFELDSFSFSGDEVSLVSVDGEEVTLIIPDEYQDMLVIDPRVDDATFNYVVIGWPSIAVS